MPNSNTTDMNIIPNTCSIIRTSSVDDKTRAKMQFIYNALQSGWTVTKGIDMNTFIFSKPHVTDTSIQFDEDLETFVYSNFNISQK